MIMFRLQVVEDEASQVAAPCHAATESRMIRGHARKTAEDFQQVRQLVTVSVHGNDLPKLSGFLLRTRFSIHVFVLPDFRLLLGRADLPTTVPIGAV